MEEKNRICRICNRRFANGKAMGGHMRSHLAKLPLPPKPIPPQQPQNLASSTEKVIQSSRSHKQGLSSMPKPNFAVVHDGESEAESLRNPTQRRSKRTHRNLLQKVAESVTKAFESPERVSFTSEIFDEEECAKCLVMLASDGWKKYNKRGTKTIGEDDDRDKHEAENEEEEDELEMLSLTPTRSKSCIFYRCQKCNKGFGSYQALGGHKASHKKMKTHVKEDECNEERRSVKEDERNEERSEEGSDSAIGGDNDLVISQRIYKCPLCDRVFESGQALGGHKKVHFTYLGLVGSANITQVTKSVHRNVIDLNLPASLATEDDGEVSQDKL